MIYKKILNSLLDPLTIPHKVLFHSNKIFNKLIYEQRYKKKEFELTQSEIFKSFNIDYEQAKKKLENLRNKFEEIKATPQLPHSEHSTFFSGLSLGGKKINNILEIGTFNAKNAFLLSILFDDAQITTVELPRDSEEFISSYKRETKNQREQFLENRDKLINSRSNLKIIEKNSINLINQFEKYDYIWVDGAHFDPILTIDIVNSLHNLNRDGLMLCDDVVKNLNNPTWRCLNLLKKEKIIDFKLIYKSLAPNYNAKSSNRKFIAVVEKK